MKNVLIVLSILMMMFSCDEGEDCCVLLAGDCDEVLIYDAHEFDTAPDDSHKINSAEVAGDCITISYSYGGGCEDVEVKLVAVDSDALSEPPTRILRLSLDDDDNCEAYVTKELSFNLTPLKQGNSGRFLLELQGMDAALMYEY